MEELIFSVINTIESYFIIIRNMYWLTIINTIMNVGLFLYIRKWRKNGW